MAMNARNNEGTQLFAIDPFPEPKNYQEWEDWLRREARVVEKWGEESNFFKATINAENDEADKGGMYQTAELFLGQTAENQRKVVEIAKFFYPFWKERALNDPKRRR